MLLQRGSAVPIVYTTVPPSSRLHLRLHRILPLSSTPRHRRLLTTSTAATELESLAPSDRTGNERASGERQEQGGGDDDDEDDELLKLKKLEDLPEQWRRSKIAWLCKELPSYTHSTFTRILNAQRKWITQDDASYILLHFLRIRTNEAAFRVYKWMRRQPWYTTNFALSTKLAECLGRDRRPAKCREVFDNMVAGGRIPRESTFHILVISYLSSSLLEEACVIYNRMIRLGGYRPRLTLHNSLFRAIVSLPGASARHFLEQAEFIFHNLDTSGLEIQKDIFTGLIWLHSYQDSIDRGRIESLRESMRGAGFDESRDLLVSIMRACSKQGDLEEGRKTWNRLLDLGSGFPSQAFVYHMEIYAKIHQPTKALELFRSMEGVSPNVVAYQKIIEVMSKAGEVEISETLMEEFVQSGLKPLVPSHLALMDMYLRLDMHDKLEATFSKLRSPNRNAYTMRLDSLVRSNRIEAAEGIFDEMQTNAAIGTSGHSCNIMLRGFLASEDHHDKAEKLHHLMLQKKYVIEPDNFANMEHVARLSTRKNKASAATKNRPVLKLDMEQREILVGLLLGGLAVESSDELHTRSHSILFEFRDGSDVHGVLRTHIHERFYEWLRPDVRTNSGGDDVPWRFSTLAHLHFGFYADQFRPNGRLVVPRLINRWLSDRVLAYWYMYGGLRTSSGDVLLRLKSGRREDAERVVRFFLSKSLNCKIKRKGKVVWIGFQGKHATGFWNMVEPFVLETAKEALDPNSTFQKKGDEMELTFDADSGSDTDR